MYTNVWYVAETSENLKGDPRHVRMLGRDFVLFRDSNGRAVCLSGVCPHRGANLGHGSCHGDGAVACPFHGWRFDATGACVMVPSQERPDKDIPARARVDSYPTQEKYGLIWAFLGEDPDAAMPLYDMPQYDDPAFRHFHYEEVWDCNYHYAKMSNFDHVHLPIVHGTPFGGDNPNRPPDHKVEFFENGFKTFIEVSTPGPKGEWGKVREKKRPTVVSRFTFFVPGWTLRGDVEIGGAGSGMRMVFYETSTPIDEETTHMRWVFTRNFMTDESMDEEHLKRNLKNIREDRAIAEAVLPKRAPSLPSERAIHVDREDRLWQAYWRVMRDMRAKGWQIDKRRLAELAADDHYRVIPSPARRAAPDGWVHDAVPRVPAQEAAQAAE